MGSDSQQPPYDICERTFQFALRIVGLHKILVRQPNASRDIARQLLRSGTSIGANVEEGQAGQSRADFISKYSIARKEARETRYWLRIIHATQDDFRKEIEPAIGEIEELIKILTAIIRKAQDNLNH